MYESPTVRVDGDSPSIQAVIGNRAEQWEYGIVVSRAMHVPAVARVPVMVSA